MRPGADHHLAHCISYAQGAGGAALFPLSFSLLFSTFPQEERGKANGYFGIPVLVAPALGPTLGGYLTQYLDWRFVFFVNLPVGIIGVLMGLKVLREEVRQPDRRIDPLGFLLAYHDVFLITAVILVPALVLGQFQQWSKRQATGARGLDQSQDAAERLGAAR